MTTDTYPSTPVPTSPLDAVLEELDGLLFTMTISDEDDDAELAYLLKVLVECAKLTGAAEALEALSTVARERGDIGQPGSPEVWEWLAWAGVGTRMEIDTRMEGQTDGLD